MSIHLIGNQYRRAPLGASVLTLVVLLLTTSCGNPEPEESRRDGPQTTPTVEAVQARYGALPLEARFSGTVRAENQVAIFPDISAPVERVVAENGDFIRAGQPLVYLRDVQFRDQLRQAEAALQVAQADAKSAEAALSERQARLARTEELVAKQFQSTAELEALQAQVAAAEAAFDQAAGRIAQAEATISEREESLRRTVVRAPVDGHVGQRNVEVGMRVTTNTRLFTLGNLQNVRVEIPVSDELMSQVNVGQPALVFPNGSASQPIRGEVARISPFLETGSFSANAEIDVDNRDGRLRPGMFVEVDVHYGESRQATLIPISALYENPSTGAFSVYVAPTLGTEIPVAEPDSFNSDDPPPISNATATELRDVTVLARGRETVGVQGISAGDWVVTVRQNLLFESLQDQPEARIRAVPWNRVVVLQGLQDEDLLRDFMAKQQRLARGGTVDSSKTPSTVRAASSQ